MRTLIQERATKKSSSLHHIHFIALSILVLYATLSKINYIHALANQSLLTIFFQLYVYGAFFGVLFLYIFSHEKFFSFAHELEKVEHKKEKKYLAKYMHYGRVLSTFIIGTAGGPIFGSLSARLLLSKYRYKYWVVLLANISSTFIAMGIGKGTLHLMTSLI